MKINIQFFLSNKPYNLAKPFMMKNNLLIFLFLFFTNTINAQISKKDSLKNLLAAEKVDSNKVNLLWQLAEQYQTVKPDTTLVLAQEALSLAQKINYADGESKAITFLATSCFMSGNYSRALENYLLNLKLVEKKNNPRKYASALNNIGITYIQLEDYSNALPYLYHADSIVKANDILVLKDAVLLNLGEAYFHLNKYDTAIYYYNKSLEIVTQKKDEDTKNMLLVSMANVFYKQHNFKPASQNYITAINFLKNGTNDDLVCEASIGLAKIYDTLGKKDSAIYFARLSYKVSTKGGFLERELNAANLLAHLFNDTKKNDSAYFYLQKTIALKDSVKGQDKIRQTQIMSSNEKLRQISLEEQRLKDKEERRQQLQLLIIGICIPILFLVTIFISRKKVHYKLIRFFGIISLLLTFEYLTLILHPIITTITHHTPFYELMAFVAFAAIIIPVHHRLEHWLIQQLTLHQHQLTKENIKLKTIKLKNKK